MPFSTQGHELDEAPLSSETIFSGRILEVCLDRVRLPDGKEADREYVRHVGGAAVLPLTDEGEVICVRQYRYAIGRMLTEIPAGKLDSYDEDPRDAALRELREETGATCKSLTYMGKFYSSPAVLDECIHMYLAEGLTFGETDFDEDEFIEIVKIPVDELVSMIRNGEIVDGKTQAAVMRAAVDIATRRNV